MGFVIKEEQEKVFVRLKDFSIIKDKNEALDLLKRNEAQQRTGAVIIIYSEIDFNDFYWKHCARIPNDNNPFTVLVISNEAIPTREEVRILIEYILKRKFKIEKNIIVIDIPEDPNIKYFVRDFYDKNFLSQPIKGSFRFRDININVSSKRLEYFKNNEILTEEQYRNINNEWKSSFTSKGKYSFKSIWLIEHTDVIKKKRLFF